MQVIGLYDQPRKAFVLAEARRRRGVIDEYLMKFKPQEIEKRLLEAQNQSFLALAACIAYPLVYYALIYYFRTPILDFLVQLPGRKSGGVFAALIVLAPFLVFPAVYHWLGERIAASVGLACPECDKYITSDRDWKICLFTGRCPHCQNYIIDRSSSPEQNENKP